MKKLFSLILTFTFMLSLALPCAASDGFSDVPADSWASEVIRRADALGLMQGVGGGAFGYGRTVKRCEFVTLLGRMLGWTPVAPQTASFADVGTKTWYYSAVETALANGSFDKSKNFRPEEPITRSEMAVMFIRALGYAPLAEEAEKLGLAPFTDVTENRGSIAVAADIGMINGVGGGRFDPAGSALREHLAAMMVRVYDRLHGSPDWLHGFYAFSSWSQHELTDKMDAVSAGWSRLGLADGRVTLNTTAALGNEWCIPQSYESITTYLDENGTPLNLDVYMDNAAGEARDILTDPQKRTDAVAAITDELRRSYTAIGKNPYSGVTIDFEGLTGQAQRAGFTAFLTQLREALDDLDGCLYVAVQPAAPDGWFDGYDYRAIGRLADRVILMAHDYNATDLTGFEGSTYYKTTALTPLAGVWYSLRAITDPDTGVQDKSKLALAISFSSLAWQTRDGLLVSGTPVYPASDTVAKRLAQPDTVTGWSETYKNPWAAYTTEDGSEYFLWYENGRSVQEELRLARLFGINGVSLWRIGLIPEDAWEALQ